MDTLRVVSELKSTSVFLLVYRPCDLTCIRAGLEEALAVPLSRRVGDELSPEQTHGQVAPGLHVPGGACNGLLAQTYT